MRLKLLLLASMLGALLGAVSAIAIVAVTLGSLQMAADPQYWRWAHGWLAFVPFAPDFLFGFLGSMFVYRHTARWRKLQASLTLVLVLILSIGMQLAWLLLH